MSAGSSTILDFILRRSTNVLERLIGGIWTDEDIRDPISLMTDLLQKSSDRSLLQKWSLWILERDSKAGLQLIMSRDTKRVSVAVELALLEKIRGANSEAGVEYLEHLVVQKGLQVCPSDSSYAKVR